jgi:hypothetical protein
MSLYVKWPDLEKAWAFVSYGVDESFRDEAVKGRRH